MDAAASLAQKTAYLRRTLEPWAELVAPVIGPDPSRRLGYRDRVTLSVRWASHTGWRFGLVRRDELIAIHDCPVHSARVRSLVHGLARCLPGGDELPLAYLHVSGAQATLIVKARQVDVAILRPAAESALRTGIEGLWLHTHPAAGRRLFARSGWQLLAGATESREPRGLLHGPTAFVQAMPELHQQAISAARGHLCPGAGTAVLDLYCGLGATLREWTGAGAAAVGVELSGEATVFASRNAPLAQVLRGTCVQRLPQVRDWWNARAADRVAFVNPPRSGLETEVTQALAEELRPYRIAYLSCSAGTLARDLRSLVTAGYEVKAILSYDFFPLTHHVEALALLDRP
jgi:tRNA/tmRNA/rRNA uracil-C5-methylase (TrmA/RlmC/RlmD family)